MGAVSAFSERNQLHKTLEHVAMDACPYPEHLLEDCETGLCLFAAAFNGRNDAVWMALAGMRVLCNDRDVDRLVEMSDLYPDEWVWLGMDAWLAAEDLLKHGHAFDVVSVDCYTGDAESKALESLDLWCSLARKLVTVTITIAKTNVYRTPSGWRSSLFHRDRDIYWLVLERV